MTLSVFELNVGRKPSGNKLLEGTVSLVNDQYTILTGLAAVRFASAKPVGYPGYNYISMITATTAGGMIVSFTNSVGTVITVVATCTCMFTGY